MADTAATAVHGTSGAAHGPEDPSKRDFLKLIAGAGAIIGAGAIAWPLIDSMNPSKDVLAASSTEVDITPIVEGLAAVVWHLLVSHPALAQKHGHWETIAPAVIAAE